MSLGIHEIILILLVVLLLFGGKKIPEIARAMGRAQYEYKKAKTAIQKEAEEFQKTVENEEKPAISQVKDDIKTPEA